MKKNIKYYILLVLSILFTIFIFVEEVMPYSWSKAQNDFISNITNKTIQFFKGNIYYDITRLDFDSKYNIFGSNVSDNTIGENEILVLKYKYRFNNKDYEKRINCVLDNKKYTDVSYEFKGDYVYFYIQSELLGDNKLSIYNGNGSLLADYSFNVVNQINNLNYDIILDQNEVMKNSYITFDYSFYKYYYDDLINLGFYKVNNHHDYYMRSDVLTIGSSNLYFKEYYIKLLYLESFNFKTSSEYIHVDPYQQIIIIDKNCNEGLHYIENEKGVRYKFNVLDMVYTLDVTNPIIELKTSENTHYLSLNHDNLEQNRVSFENINYPKFIVKSTNMDSYYFFPYFYLDDNGNKLRSKMSFYTYMKEITEGDTYYVETVSEYNGIHIKSNTLELHGYTKEDVPKHPNTRLEEYKTYPVEIYNKDVLLKEDESIEIKKGETLIFDILINHEGISYDVPLYAYSSNSNIIKVTIDEDESKLYIECLDYGSSKITFIKYYQNEYKLTFYTKDAYMIERIGDLSLDQFVQKNLGHIACYIILGLLIGLTIYAYFGFKSINLKIYGIFMIATILYGLICESLQELIPNRYTSPLDFLRNSISIAIGYFIIYLIYFFKSIFTYKKKLYQDYF